MIDSGYGKKYYTGKTCIVRGCEKPAGTYWGKYWCKEHDIERRKNIDKDFENLKKLF